MALVTTIRYPSNLLRQAYFFSTAYLLADILLFIADVFIRSMLLLMLSLALTGIASLPEAYAMRSGARSTAPSKRATAQRRYSKRKRRAHRFNRRIVPGNIRKRGNIFRFRGVSKPKKTTEKNISTAGQKAIDARLKERAISKGRQRRAISGVVKFLSRKARGLSRPKGRSSFVEIEKEQPNAKAPTHVTDILEFADEEAMWDFEDIEITFDADPNVYAIDHPMMEKGIIDVWVRARAKKNAPWRTRLKLAFNSEFNSRYTVTFRGGGDPVVVERASNSAGARLIRAMARVLPIRAVISDISTSRSSRQGVLAGILGIASMQPTTAILGVGVMVSTLRLQAEKRESKQKAAVTKAAEYIAKRYKDRGKFPSLVSAYNHYKRIIQTPSTDGSAVPKSLSIREFTTRLGTSEKLPFPSKSPKPTKRRIGF